MIVRIVWPGGVHVTEAGSVRWMGNITERTPQTQSHGVLHIHDGVDTWEYPHNNGWFGHGIMPWDIPDRPTNVRMFEIESDPVIASTVEVMAPNGEWVDIERWVAS